MKGCFRGVESAVDWMSGVRRASAGKRYICGPGRKGTMFLRGRDYSAKPCTNRITILKIYTLHPEPT